MCSICILGIDKREFMINYGKEFFRLCLSEYDKQLRSLGSTLQDFISNLDGLQDHLKESAKFAGVRTPSFRCTMAKDGGLNMHYNTERRNMEYFIIGMIQAAALQMFEVEILIKTQQNGQTDSNHFAFYIQLDPKNLSRRSRVFATAEKLSTRSEDSKIGVVTFCQTFPFHVMFDRDLTMTQLGAGLMKTIAPEIGRRGRHLLTYFNIIRPSVEANFMSFLTKINRSFQLEMKWMDEGSNCDETPVSLNLLLCQNISTSYRSFFIFV